MQNRYASGTKPHKRNSGSFNKTRNTSLSPNRSSLPKRDSVPIAEHPYVRSSSAIYSGGDRAIFRKHDSSRRNAIVLCIMVGICIVMAGVLIGFSLGKEAALAEANTAEDAGISIPTASDGEEPTVTE